MQEEPAERTTAAQKERKVGKAEEEGAEGNRNIAQITVVAKWREGQEGDAMGGL